MTTSNEIQADIPSTKHLFGVFIHAATAAHASRAAYLAAETIFVKRIGYGKGVNLENLKVFSKSSAESLEEFTGSFSTIRCRDGIDADNLRASIKSVQSTIETTIKTLEPQD